MSNSSSPARAESSAFSPSRRPWFAVTTIAVIVGVTVLIGNPLLTPSDGPMVYEAGRLVASGQLEQVLDDPSLGGREEGPSVTATSKQGQGSDCRQFADGPVTGVACRQGGDWRIKEVRQE